MADVVSGYLSMVDEQLPLIADRLRGVQVLRRPAAEVVRTWDSPATLFYCDPPYLHSTRQEGSRSVYGYEMSEADHVELSEALRSCRGRVVLSGYPSPLYDRLYGGWRTASFEVANHAAGGASKARKQEVLWMNW
jgi:DNA adenine methylase